MLGEATATRPVASLRLREPTGSGVKHLVEVSTIRWNCVNDQPESIRKASPRSRMGPDLGSPKAPHYFAPPSRDDLSPSGAFVRVEMAASRHVIRQQRCRDDGGRIATAGRMRRRPHPSRSPRRTQGFEAESRRERWSPEPGHLMGGELGDEGGKTPDRRAAADGARTPAEAPFCRELVVP